MQKRADNKDKSQKLKLKKSGVKNSKNKKKRQSVLIRTGRHDRDGRLRLDTINLDNIRGKEKPRPRRMIDTCAVAPQQNHDGVRCFVYGATGKGKTNNILQLFIRGAMVWKKIITFASKESIRQKKFVDLEKNLRHLKEPPKVLLTSEAEEVPEVHENETQTVYLFDDLPLSTFDHPKFRAITKEGRNPGCSFFYLAQNTEPSKSKCGVNETIKSFYNNASHVILHKSPSYRQQIAHIYATIFRVPNLSEEQFRTVYEKYVMEDPSKFAFLLVDYYAPQLPTEIQDEEDKILTRIFGFTFNPLQVRCGWDNTPFPDLIAASKS
jgi:hypothetical protein